jgi:hypothetical protein
VTSGKQQQQQPPPPGPTYAQLALKHPDVEDALQILGKESVSLNMGDLYKVFEIVRDHGSQPGRGKADALIEKGWMSKEDKADFIAAADRPDISGDQARHARAHGKPPARRLTPSEARLVIAKLVTRWLDSL